MNKITKCDICPYSKMKEGGLRCRFALMRCQLEKDEKLRKQVYKVLGKIGG